MPIIIFLQQPFCFMRRCHFYSGHQFQSFKGILDTHLNGKTFQMLFSCMLIVHVRHQFHCFHDRVPLQASQAVITSPQNTFHSFELSHIKLAIWYITLEFVKLSTMSQFISLGMHFYFVAQQHSIHLSDLRPDIASIGGQYKSILFCRLTDKT